VAHAVVLDRYAKIRAIHGADAADLATRHELAAAQAKIAHGDAWCALPERYLFLLDMLSPITTPGAPCASPT
jgi:hypothetical protein